MKKMVVILCIVVLGIAFLVMPVAAAQEDCWESWEESLNHWCKCSLCDEELNFQATPTCDGLEFTWNDIGADYYRVFAFDPTVNHWYVIPGDVTGTDCFIHNTVLPHETYSFVIGSFNSQSQPGVWCFSNIVCDVELPTTCTNTPEFPSIFLPAAMIIGFLGAVLLIQRTRK